MPRQLTLERARLIVAYLERVEAYYEQQRQQAIDEAAKWKAEADSFAAAVAHSSDLQDEAEARCEQAIDALRVYADPRNWSVSRDDLNHRVVAWIGPGAEKAGMPDALETARAALVSLGETE